MANKKKINLSKYAIIIVFVIVCVLLSIVKPQFLTVDNILNVLRQISITGFIAIGMLMVIITGGIDLSVGVMVGLCAAIGCDFCHPGQPWFIGILVGLGIGALFGLISGLLIACLDLPPFIATLATKLSINGLALLYTDGHPTTNLDEGFLKIGGGSFLGLPIPVWILIVCLVIGFILLNHTIFGRYLYAIGGNEKSAKLSGVPVRKVKVFVYMISGIFAGLSGMILSSRVAAGSPVAGLNYEMDAITIVVVGGCSLAGGSGTIPGAISGMLLIGVVTNGMNLLNISSYWQLIVKGIIILLAVIMDIQTKKRKD